MLLKLPIPPSVNHCYVSKSMAGRVVRFQSSKFKSYVVLVRNQKIERDLEMFRCPVQVHIEIYFKVRVTDIDNILKVLFDALEDAQIIENDRLITKLSINKQQQSQEPYITIQIEAIK